MQEEGRVLLYFDSLLKQETKGVYDGRRNQKTEKAVCVHTTMNPLDIYLFSYLLLLLHTSLHSYAHTQSYIATLIHPYAHAFIRLYIHTSLQ